MAQVTIYGKRLTKAESELLKGLVAEAACGDGEISVVDSVESQPQAGSDPVLIILGTSATCADPELESNLMCAHKTAQRVIWVWPSDTLTEELPSAAAKYCYSYIPWDPKKLAAVAADDDFTCFETPAGKKVPSVTTERNLCADDEDGGGKKKAKNK